MFYSVLAGFITANVAGGVYMIRTRRKEARRVALLRRVLVGAPSNEVFREEMAAELPAPARRYLLHAIAPGTPLAASVRLRMTGFIRVRSESNWSPFEGEEVLAVPRGLVWSALVRSSMGRARFTDTCFEGAGTVHVQAWGLVPLVHLEGPDISRSAVGRLVGESMFQPSALLPQRGVRWEAVDDHSADARIEAGGQAHTIRITVDDVGRLRSAAYLRWGDGTEDKRYDSIPFGGEIEEERSFGGYTISSQVTGGWWYGTDRYIESYRVPIEEAEFG
jgi:hypothetical protein